MAVVAAGAGAATPAIVHNRFSKIRESEGNDHMLKVGQSSTVFVSVVAERTSAPAPSAAIDCCSVQFLLLATSIFSPLIRSFSTLIISTVTATVANDTSI